jgi:hypothetical protein
MSVVDHVNQVWNSPDQAIVGAETLIESERIGQGTWGLVRQESFLQITLPLINFGYRPIDMRGRLTIDIVYEAHRHHLTRSAVIPPPHSSEARWLTELHIRLPGTGEVMKFGLGNRRLEGWRRYDAGVDLDPPGTERRLSAVSQGAYDFSQPIRLQIGSYSEHRLAARQMRVFSKASLRVRIAGVSFCPAP